MYYYISWYTKGEVGHLCAAASGRWILLKQSCAICKWIGVKYLLPAFFILCCCGYLHRRHTGCELGFPSGPTNAATIYLYVISIYTPRRGSFSLPTLLNPGFPYMYKRDKQRTRLYTHTHTHLHLLRIIDDKDACTCMCICTDI